MIEKYTQVLYIFHNNNLEVYFVNDKDLKLSKKIAHANFFKNGRTLTSVEIMSLVLGYDVVDMKVNSNKKKVLEQISLGRSVPETEDLILSGILVLTVYE